ncbi:MAG: PqqD family protein [Lachnospiraceae bacterium]|nr:PqqD family protein [Lachnospiraceae bacterium]
MIDINLKNYEIHDVAGTHFLVNVSQSGDVFEKPLEINEFASEVLKHMKDGMSVEETAKTLSLEYEADYEEIFKDVNDFLNVLNEKIV